MRWLAATSRKYPLDAWPVSSGFPRADFIGISATGTIYLSQLLKHWNHEVTEVITKNVELHSLGPSERLRRAAEIIVDNDLVRYEIGIRQWAMNDKRAARAVRTVNRQRLDFARQTLREIGFSDDEVEMRAMLFRLLSHLGSADVPGNFPEKAARTDCEANRFAHTEIGPPESICYNDEKTLAASSTNV